MAAPPSAVPPRGVRAAIAASGRAAACMPTRHGAAVTVTLKNALVSSNTAEEYRPGVGGKGFPGFGGAGGSYTGGFGGGIYLNQNASLASDTINSNSASGGLIVPAARLTLSPAGTGKSGGAGGNGATGAGGGLFVAGGTITVTSCTFEFNKATWRHRGQCGRS